MLEYIESKLVAINDAKSVTYVVPGKSQEMIQSIVDRMAPDLPLVFDGKDRVQDLFPLLANPDFHTDYILIEIDQLYNMQGSHIFEVIQTLSMLIKYRSTSKKIEILVLIGDTAPATLIKEVLSIAEISNIVLKHGGSFGYDDVLRQWRCVLNGHREIPEKLRDLLNPKIRRNSSNNRGDIKLTDRQTQVLRLVQSRGSSNKQIARMLDISESTVKLHIGSILKKYGLTNRTQLALFTKDCNL